jgi:hypothetical protein
LLDAGSPGDITDRKPVLRHAAQHSTYNPCSQVNSIFVGTVVGTPSDRRAHDAPR